MRLVAPVLLLVARSYLNAKGEPHLVTMHRTHPKAPNEGGLKTKADPYGSRPPSGTSNEWQHVLEELPVTTNCFQGVTSAQPQRT